MSDFGFYGRSMGTQNLVYRNNLFRNVQQKPEIETFQSVITFLGCLYFWVDLLVRRQVPAAQIQPLQKPKLKKIVPPSRQALLYLYGSRFGTRELCKTMFPSAFLRVFSSYVFYLAQVYT